MHFGWDNYNYAFELYKDKSTLYGEPLDKILFEYGISTDYNQPMTLEQIQKKPHQWKKTVYNNIKATHNLVNIMSVKGRDLDFDDNQNQTILLTYSFPCQDLSLAGKMKGMSQSQANGGTRSGLLWEIERILVERERESLPLPNILLMENVPQIIGVQNKNDFIKWIKRLEQFGYSNYYQLLNAKNYGIPQNRNRCFMISILGEYNYKFPNKKKLKLKLEDLLESNVDEKYYLTQKQIENINSWNAYEKPFETMKKIEKTGISPTLTTRTGDMTSSMILLGTYQYAKSDKFMQGKPRFTEGKNIADCIQTSQKEGVVVIGNYSPSGHNAARVIDPEGIAPTVMENHGTVTAIPIKNNTKKGFLLAEEGDAIDISGRMQYHRGTVQKGMSQTISTAGGNNIGVVIKKDTENYIEWEEPGKLDIDCRAFKEDKIAPATTTTPKGKVLLNDLRIRKLTAKECFRLMGVKDEDYEKIKVNQSESSLYHLAGDSIVVNVLEAIINNLL